MKKTIIFTLFLFLIFTASCGIGDNIGVKTQDPVIETPTPTESKVTEVPLTETPEETPPPTPEPTKTPQKTTPKPTSTPSPTPHIDNTLAVDIGVFTFNNELGVKDGMYTIGEDFEMLLEEKEEHEFNKYIIKYTSTDYLKGYIHYSLGRTSHLEEFFLEPGTNKEFSSLVDGFFNNQKGAKIKKIALNSIKGSSANFKLVDFKVDIVSVPATVVYLENDYHQVGIDLLWGGAINYIKDKTNKDGSLDNLLNRADTGRLVQQSYYGTMNPPYVKGEFMGNDWPYNPVQGGDKGNNSSKIVDFEIYKEYIYIKCRPLDWGHINSPTFSYMENEYRLEENAIVVKNRFVDFSGYKANARHQELPAFYVISYLDTFVYYNGTKPWTDDTLTYKHDLEFWGGNSNAYFNVRKGNTETWCAWVDSSDYGIGLFTPNVEILLAGRFSYNGSKDPKNSATNYVAPLRTFEMKSFEPFEYSYYIVTGKVNDIREAFRGTFIEKF
jgi:hypothetical protein